MRPDSDASALEPYGLAPAAGAIRSWLVRARWFGGRRRQVARVGLDDLAVLRPAAPTVLFTVWRVEYADGGSEIYSLPLGVRTAAHLPAELATGQLIDRVGTGDGALVVYDALADPEAAIELWRMLAEEREVATAAGGLAGRRFTDIDTATPDPPRLLDVEQSNSAVVRGHLDFLKWSRRIEPGPSVELEMALALAERGFPHVPALRGQISYRRGAGVPALQALLHSYLQNGTEGWRLALTSLRDLYASAEEAEGGSALERWELVDDQGGSFQGEAARLGAVTAELHLALADPGLEGVLAPSPVAPEELAAWADAMTAQLDRLLASGEPVLGPLGERRAVIVARFDALRTLREGGLAIRVHGDYHLGQVLRTDDGWKIVDFEGEPAGEVGERRRRSSPLRDVAGMFRSFDYAAAAALAERTQPRDPLWHHLVAAGDAWALANREAFWAAYLQRLDGSGLLPGGGGALVVRRAFEVSKAVYEVGYELGHRPDWVEIPLRFLLAAAP
ncbi:MAG: maltokinase N-terminal cap-like domain-containing protein [Candidatus Dormibacteria bacterium]